MCGGADQDRNPFNDSLIASGSDDGKVRLSRSLTYAWADRTGLLVEGTGELHITS